MKKTDVKQKALIACRNENLKRIYISSFRSKKTTGGKVERIEEDSLDLIPLPSVKIQIISGKVYLR